MSPASRRVSSRAFPFAQAPESPMSGAGAGVLQTNCRACRETHLHCSSSPCGHERTPCPSATWDSCNPSFHNLSSQAHCRVGTDTRQNQQSPTKDVMPAGSEEEPDWDRSHVIICSPGSAGCSGQLDLRLTWQSEEQQHPEINAEVLLDPLQVPHLATCHLSWSRLQAVMQPQSGSHISIAPR